MTRHPQASSQIFNNADSFAQAFDDAWQEHQNHDPGHGLAVSEKLELILERVGEHPFAAEDPAMARQVAEFRVRLLGL